MKAKDIKMIHMSLEEYLEIEIKRITENGLTSRIYSNINKERENLIANILVNTGSSNYAKYKGSGKYTVRNVSDLNIIIVESCYLIYSKKESRYMLKSFAHNNYINMNKEAYKILTTNEECIFIDTIYSSETGKGHAQKAIDKIKQIKLPIITDTYTAQLAHLCKKNNIPLIKDRTDEDLEYKYFKI